MAPKILQANYIAGGKRGKKGKENHHLVFKMQWMFLTLFMIANSVKYPNPLQSCHQFPRRLKRYVTTTLVFCWSSSSLHRTVTFTFLKLKQAVVQRFPNGSFSLQLPVSLMCLLKINRMLMHSML